MLKTQNAISNLQAKLHGGRSNYSNISPQLTSSLISEKTLVSRLPVSQLSRSNSLNYRLRRKDQSGDSSPLRSPGPYVVTGSSGVPSSTRLLLNSASRSLDSDPHKQRDSNMNSPTSDKGLLSHSSDDKTLSNRPSDDTVYRKTHTRHKSFDGRNIKDYIKPDLNNANVQVNLKTVLKSQAIEAQNFSPRGIDQSRHLGDGKRGNHQRNFSDTDKVLRRIHSPTNIAFGTSIKRSSSFSTVNKNNNYLETGRVTSRPAIGTESIVYKDVDYLSDESENMNYKKTILNRNSDLKSKAPSNSPKCPNTPEMQRKFGPGLVRNSVRVTNRERTLNTRMSEPPMSKEDKLKPSNHQSRKLSDTTRQAVMNRLTKSRSSTREFQPKNQEKG